MAEQSTFIKLDRNILRWRWFKNTNTLIVFIWLLIEANVSDHDFENTTIHRGQVATSIRSIGNACGLSIQQVRTALDHLKSTGEITIKSNNRYQVITIVNYKLYQDISTNKTTGKQQSNNKRITNNQQQYKNDKNGKKEKNIPPKSPKGDLTPSEPIRGTDEFRNISHLLLKPEEGTADDIPVQYRELCNNDFATYVRYRNQ